MEEDEKSKEKCEFSEKEIFKILSSVAVIVGDLAVSFLLSVLYSVSFDTNVINGRVHRASIYRPVANA